MKAINNALIRSLGACYDPSRYVKDENETLSVLEWLKKYRGTVPDEDIIWLLCHEEFLSNKDLRLFAVWCARGALKLVKNPDIRSVKACNVAERYANGEATDEELEDANTAATAARSTARSATARSTDRSAAYVAYVVAAYVAYVVAYRAAHTVACYTAGGDTTIRASQLDKLLTYFKRPVATTAVCNPY